jgi:hypothetical protein
MIHLASLSSKLSHFHAQHLGGSDVVSWFVPDFIP